MTERVPEKATIDYKELFETYLAEENEPIPGHEDDLGALLEALGEEHEAVDVRALPHPMKSASMRHLLSWTWWSKLCSIHNCVLLSSQRVTA